MADGMVANLVAGFRHDCPWRQASAPVRAAWIDIERASKTACGQHRYGPVQLGMHPVIKGQGHGAVVSIRPGIGVLAGHGILPFIRLDYVLISPYNIP